jgi:hypothetical protein
MEREEKRCRMCDEAREIIEHIWNGCREMRKRERTERGEILNEDRREKRWMREIWKGGREQEKKGVGDRK